jgi:hypothetical protein
VRGSSVPLSVTTSDEEPLQHVVVAQAVKQHLHSEVHQAGCQCRADQFCAVKPLVVRRPANRIRCRQSNSTCTVTHTRQVFSAGQFNSLQLSGC